MHQHSHDHCTMLTIVEAARILRVAVATTRYWRQIDYGPRSFKVGRHVRYWECEVRDWLQPLSDPPQRPVRAVR